MAEVQSDIEWKSVAECNKNDPDGPFAENAAEEARFVASVCGGCAVRAQCLSYKFSNDIEYGIWGGMRLRVINQVGLQLDSLAPHSDDEPYISNRRRTERGVTLFQDIVMLNIRPTREQWVVLAELDVPEEKRRGRVSVDTLQTIAEHWQKEDQQNPVETQEIAA